MMAFCEVFWRGMALHLWQTTLVLMMLFALGTLLRTAPARLSGILWWAGLFKLMLPLSLLAPLVGGSTRTLLQGLVASDSAAGAGLQAVVLAFDPTAWSPSPAPPVEPSSPPFWALLTFLWLSGASVILLRFFRAAVRAQARAALPPEALSDAVRLRCQAALEGTALPCDRVVLCADRAMPAVSGWIRPRVFLPRAVVEALTVDELRGVLLHEDAHRRRRDPLLSAVRSVVCAAFHFYPLLWPLLGRLRRNAELACDEAVLRFGVAPEVYARALARTVLMGLHPAQAPAAADPHRPSLLQERFERITRSTRYKTMTRHRLTLAAAALLVAASFFLPDAGLAELRVNELVSATGAPQVRDLDPRMPTVRLHATRFAVPPIATTREELQLPLGCFVGIRLMAAVNAKGEAKAISTERAVVLAGLPDCQARDGSALAGGDSKFQDAVAQGLFKDVPFEPPASKDLGSDNYVIGWFEIRWQIPAEGSLEFTKPTVIQAAEHDVALVLLPSMPELQGAAQPRLVAESRVDPDYPKSERKSGISGDVMVQALVGGDGAVTDVAVLQGIDGHPAFAESAVAAVKLWRFTPVVVDGKPVRFAYTVTVRFALD